MKAKNVVAAALALAVWGIGGAARAEDAASLLRDGVELRRQGKDREALGLFERAAALESSPRIIAQMALAEQALGLWVKAEGHLKAALDGKDDPWIRKNQKLLADCWAVIGAHVASLEVWGNPAGAEVVVEGEVVGTLPFEHPVRVPVGDLTVRVRAKGYVEASQVVTVSKDGFVRTHVELAVVPSLPTAPVATAPEGASAVLVAKDGGGAPADEATPVYQRWWFWAAAGAVVAGAAVSTYLLTRPSGATTCMPAPGVTCVTW